MEKPSSLTVTRLSKAALFIGTSIATLVLFGKGLPDLYHLVMHEEEYTHLALVPLISGFFLWSGRKKFISETGNKTAGIILISIGLTYGILMNFFSWKDPISALSLKTIGAIVIIYGAFILNWGFNSFKKVLFPFIFILLSIPFPHHVLNSVISFLQWGSAVMVDGIFSMLGETYLRDGTSFHLNSVSISIAPQCSGIRSTMALIITGAVAAEMFLKSFKNKVIMFLLIIPFSLLKNAIRIVTITLLAQYVDIAFLTHSFLHKSGGIFFYLIVLAIYFPLLFLLARLEMKRATSLG